MNTLYMTAAGFVFSMLVCVVMAVAFVLGYGEPNVIPEAGETYLGWWLMVIGTTTLAGTIWGVVFDTIGIVQRLIRKS